MRQGDRPGFIPNPKLKLLDQLSEVMRIKHYSIRTERTYRERIKPFISLHGKSILGRLDLRKCPAVRQSSSPATLPLVICARAVI